MTFDIMLLFFITQELISDYGRKLNKKTAGVPESIAVTQKLRRSSAVISSIANWLAHVSILGQTRRSIVIEGDGVAPSHNKLLKTKLLCQKLILNNVAYGTVRHCNIDQNYHVLMQPMVNRNGKVIPGKTY